MDDWTATALRGPMPPCAAYLGADYDAILEDMWQSDPVLRYASPMAPTMGLPLPRPSGQGSKELPPPPAGGNAQWTVLPSLLNPATRTARGVARVPLFVAPWSSLYRGDAQRSTGDTLGLYYEIHGHGPVRICLIMGLNMSHTAWLLQVEFFMRHPETYSVLVFDNRGWGNSETPGGRYTTTQQAQDLILLLSSKEVGWLPPAPESTEKFSFSPATHKIHFAGVSMGGMILLELLRITLKDGEASIAASATLISTTSGHAYKAADVEANELMRSVSDPSQAVKKVWTGLPPLPGVHMIVSAIARAVLKPETPMRRIERVNSVLFSPGWRSSPSVHVKESNELLLQQGRTKDQLWHAPDGEVATNGVVWAFVSLWRAAVFARLQPRADLSATLAAISATLTHQVRTSALQAIDAALSFQGTSRLTVVCGTWDNLVNDNNSRHLLSVMPHAKAVWVEGAGHALGVEAPEQLNEAIWSTIQRTQTAAGLPPLPPPK